MIEMGCFYANHPANELDRDLDGIPVASMDMFALERAVCQSTYVSEMEGGNTGR
jgi:hypothetical protein